MALRTFETDTAQYYLGLGNHATSSAPIFEDVDVKSLDFLVLEGNGSTFKTHSDIFERTQYREFEKLQEEFHFPIYLVDHGTLPESNSGKIVATNLSEGPVYILGFYLLSKALKREKDEPKMSRRKLLKRIGQSMTGTVLFSPALQLVNSSTGDIAPITEINNLRTNVLPTYFLSFRDAVAARKMGRYLVPKHQHQDGSKVQVGVLYGAMHSGIETKLKRQWITDATIWLYQELFEICDNNTLNMVVEVPEKEALRYHDCGLFK